MSEIAVGVVILVFAAMLGALLGALHNADRAMKLARRASAQADDLADVCRRWEQAYEAKAALNAELYTRIDTLEGELTAQDISHSKAIRAARKNDHRDAKGRYAPAHDPYVNR
jgi:hypothetical protein